MRFFAFSFHPGLRRTADYHKYLRPLQSFFQEDYINTWLYWHGFYMVKLPLRYCNHLDINTISRHMEYHTEGLDYKEAKKGRSGGAHHTSRSAAHFDLPQAPSARGGGEGGGGSDKPGAEATSSLTQRRARARQGESESESESERREEL